MELFDEVVRGDGSPASYNESRFSFLNRAATPYWAEVRRVLEQWFQRVPADNKSDLLGRFRNDDDRQSVGALWELYLHELFSCLGFVVRLHPEIGGQSTKPDLAVDRADSALYVEAVVLTPTEAEHQSDRRRGAVHDAINKRVRSRDFFLNVETIRESAETPPLRKITEDLISWLDSLAPIELPLSPGSGVFEQLPTLHRDYGRWSFRFQALPKRPDRRGTEGRIVGMTGPPEAIFVNDHIALRRRIEEKASRYGDPDKPLVIALLYDRWTADSESVARALYGSGIGFPEVLKEGRTDPSWGDYGDGAWVTRRGPAARRASAVLTAFRFGPHALGSTRLQLWHHPWAYRPLQSQLPFESISLDLASGKIENSDSLLQPWEILGLPEFWPPGEPFDRISLSS